MSNNDNNREQRRRFSSLQRKFGGTVKKKLVTAKPLDSPKQQPVFEFAKLKRSGRRPTYERVEEKLELIPEESETRNEPHSDVSNDYEDAEETTEASGSSTTPSVEAFPTVESRRESKPPSPASSPESPQSPARYSVESELSGQSQESPAVERRDSRKESDFGSWQRGHSGEIASESREESPISQRAESSRKSSVSWQTAKSRRESAADRVSLESSGSWQTAKSLRESAADRVSLESPGSWKNAPTDEKKPQSRRESAADRESLESPGSWKNAPTDEKKPQSRRESAADRESLESSGLWKTPHVDEKKPESRRESAADRESLESPGSWKTPHIDEKKPDSRRESSNSKRDPQPEQARKLSSAEPRRRSVASTQYSPSPEKAQKGTPESNVTEKSLVSRKSYAKSPSGSQQSPDQYSTQQDFGNLPDAKSVRSNSRKSINPETKLAKSRKSSKRSSLGANDDFDSPLPPPPGFSPPSRVREAAYSIPDNVSRKSRKFSGYSVLEEEDDEESGYIPEKRNSIQFPVLEDREKYFHELVAAGDVEAVQQFLREDPSFNINCVSYEKTSALKMAIRDLNEAMAIFLLNRQDINACDAVLTAVKTGNLEMLGVVLECLENSHPGLEFTPCPFSADFPEDVTALMLAAQEGKFEVVDLLLSRGHRMPDIHQPFCTCRKCKEDVRKYDYLKYSTMKINQYKAVASPMYFFQTTSDPIRRAFELTGELQAAARMFPQFHGDYEELWKNLRVFSAEFIGCCRTSEEVELILNQPAGCDAAGALFFPRLQFAIDTNQKEFVAHPSVQAVLESVWTGEAKDWKTKSALNQALAPFLRIPVLFFAFPLSCCLPTHGILKKFQAPVNKFISSFAAYIIFLTMIFSLSAQGKVHQKRGPPKSYLKWPIMLFVCGHIWGSFRLCFQLGPKRFFSIGWNCFDCLTHLCFTFIFIFWVAAWADVTAYDDANLPRRFWNAWDPTLIAEGLLVIATIMTYLRLFLPLSLNYYIGPLQVSIGKMMLDVARFVLVFALLIFAWTAGLCHLYEPYSGMVQTDPATGDKTTQVDSFVNFSMTLKTFFWAIFGVTSIEAADVIIENPEGTASTVINEHIFTQGVGYFCFAVFSFFAVIVVLNMLVACMANTFTKVIDNIPVEWVFGRTKVYIIYMYHSMFPSPFNLFPKLDDLTSGLTYLSLIPKKKAKCSLTHCCYIERTYDAYCEKDFQKLMSDLAQRYIHLKKSEEGDDEDEKKTA